MNPSEFVLTLLESNQGSIKGRTLLQKTCYFVAVLLEFENEMDFHPHFYGPYSPLIDQAVNELVGLGLIEQKSIGFGASDIRGFEVRRYDFKITDDGQEVLQVFRRKDPDTFRRIQTVAQKIKDLGDINYFDLSIAAKAYHVIRSQNRALTRQEIVREASHLGWKIEPTSLNQAVRVLQALGLAASN